MSRPPSPNPPPAQSAVPLPRPALPGVQAALARVRRRLRLQRALQHGVYGLLVGGGLAFCATLTYRLGGLSQPQLRQVSLAAFGLFFVGLLVGALRRIDPLQVAARIDASHALHDRLSSALQFTGVGSTPPPAPLGPEAALRELAIADAEQAARRVEAHRAAPFVRPQRLGWIPILGLLTLFALWIRLPRPAVTPSAKAPAAPGAEARLIVDGELIAPEKDELRRLLAEAEARGDQEAAAILRELQKLLEQVERGELTRKEAFDKLSELEQRLMQGKDGALEELKEKLRRAGNELSEAKLTKELGQALAKEDLAKAQAELKKLASEARTQSDKDKSERQAMAKAFERAAQGLRQNDANKSAQANEAKERAQAEERARRMNELQAEERRLKEQLEKNPQDKEAKKRLEEVQRELEQLREQAKREQEQKQQEQKQQEQAEKNKKDEWQNKTREEERTRRQQELQEEERRLKKKMQENPQDEESERRLKKVQRELEQLEREKQEREQARRELEQLERDMQRAAEEMQKQLDRMSPEQRKALEKMMEDMQRLQEQLRRMGQGQGQNGQPQPGQGQQGQGQGQGQGRGPVTIALGSIKQVLRRVGRSSQGQGQQGQGQGQQGQGQQGQGQQGQGMSGSMKDFMNRAKGQGQGQGKGGDSDVLIEGEGQGKDGQSMILLGQGNDPVILPGMGLGQGQRGGGPGQNPGQGSSGNQPGGDRPGTQHDPNMTGDVTQIDSKRRLTRVYGKEGAGPTRSETILGAAERGFSSQPYRKVYGDYTAVSERAMSQQRVPPGYRFYVKRYFQMIKPRE